jgi:hypothetical protein
VPEEIVAVLGEHARAVAQSADIVLGAAPDLPAAAWWIAWVFAQYPGCLVVAIRHDRGRWCRTAARERESELSRAGFGTPLDLAAVETLARDCHRRLVTP